MESKANRKTIGVFDSGLGGLTVVRAVRSRLPNADVVYLGDSARVPYGNKSARTVAKYAGTCTSFFAPYAIDLLLVACNTATAWGIAEVKARTSAEVIGAVIPGAETAFHTSDAGHIGVLSTLATHNSSVYAQEIGRLSTAAAKDVTVTSVPAPLLVPLAEEGWADHAVAVAVAREYIAALQIQDPDIDTIVLGCTHYPLLRDAISLAANDCFGRDVAIVDSASSMAEKAAALLATEERTELAKKAAGQLRCFITDESRIGELAIRFLGEEPHHVELVDLVVT